MLDLGSNCEFLLILVKCYFIIGEVSELCDVKLYVLCYWEIEFFSFELVKWCGNCCYYQCYDVLMVCQICGLFYEQGYMIGGVWLCLEGVGVCDELVLSNQIIKQMWMELEEVL